MRFCASFSKSLFSFSRAFFWAVLKLRGDLCLIRVSRDAVDGVRTPPSDFRHIVPSFWSFFFQSASSTACSRFFLNASSTSTRGLSSSSEAVVVVSMEVDVSFRARGENDENENHRDEA